MTTTQGKMINLGEFLAKADKSVIVMGFVALAKKSNRQDIGDVIRIMGITQNAMTKFRDSAIRDASKTLDGVLSSNEKIRQDGT